MAVADHGTGGGWCRAGRGLGGLALAVLLTGLPRAGLAEDDYLATLPADDPWRQTIDEMAANGCRAEPGELMMAAMERGLMPDATMDRLGKTAAAGHLDSQGGDADGENLYILKNWKGC